jgi:hypothetical protein
MSKILAAVLKLTLDKETLKQSEKQVEKFEDHLELLERRGGSIRVEYLRTWSALKSGAIDAATATKRLEDQMKAIEEHGDKVRNFAGYFGDIAGTLGTLGAGIAGPIVLAAGLYVSKAGQADEVSRNWLATTQELERSQMRIGRVAAQELLPLLEKLADLSEKAAGFVEQHPGAVKAALGVGGTLLGLATIATVAEKGIRLVADVSSLASSGMQLAAGKLMQSAAKEQLTAAGIMQKSFAGIGGAKGAAMIGGAAVASYGVNEGYKGLASSAFSGLESLLGKSEEELGSVYQGIKRINTEYGVGIYQIGAYWDMLTGEFGEVEQAAESAAEGVGELGRGIATLANSPAAGEILEGFIAFQEEAKAAEAQYGEARAQIVTDYGKQQTEATKTYEARRAEQIEEFAQRQAQEESDWNRQRERELRDFNQSQARETQQFQTSQAQSLREHLASITSIQDQANKEQAKAKERYEAQVADFLKDEGKAEQKAEADYYKNRRKLAAQFNEEVRKAEADHQKQMRRMQEDHLLSLEDAVRAQDAIGFLSEQRNYERDRGRAEEDYGDQVKEQSKEFAQATKEMEEEFKAQREQRQQEREERLAEMQTQYEQEKAERERQTQERITQEQTRFEQEQAAEEARFTQQQAEAQARFDQKRTDDEQEYNIQRERAQQHHDEMLKKDEDAYRQQLDKLDQSKREALNTLSEQYREEQRAREKAFADQVRQLDAALIGEQNARQKHYAQMSKQLDAWLQKMQQSANQRLRTPTGADQEGAGSSTGGTDNPYYPGRASGGYVSKGIYQMHDNEFVMNAGTTKAFEGMMGGPLSQDKLLAALAGGAGSRGNTSISNRNEFNFSERDDARQIMAAVEQLVNKTMTQYARGYK